MYKLIKRKLRGFIRNSLINDFEPLEMYRGEEDPETSERLVEEIKKILEK